MARKRLDYYGPGRLNCLHDPVHVGRSAGIIGEKSYQPSEYLTMSRFWLSLGAILAGLSVCLGAFAAHGLDDFFKNKYPTAEQKEVAGQPLRASYKYLQDFKTGAEYQMYHALALIAVGILSQSRKSRAFNVAGCCFLIGIVLFSGMLYALTLTGQKILGAIVPLGGVGFILGWISLAIGVLASRETATAD
jgi:uncharacterized membrane protein YgdD (TMEM256/DUF423 family)